MNHRTPSPIASRPGRCSRSECPGCESLSCRSAHASAHTAEGIARPASDAELTHAVPHRCADIAVPSALEQLLTIEQVAGALSVSPKTVKRLLDRGFPCVRVGRSVRFEPQAVVRWLSARRE